MRTLKTVPFLVLMALTCIPAFGNAKQIKVEVNGMVCDFCSQGITKKFKAQDAVENVQIDMNKKEVLLSLKEGKDLENSLIEKLIKDAGVNVSKINR